MDSILSEKWFQLSLVEQMLNIGNEVKRALRSSSESDKKICFLTRRYGILSLQWKIPKMHMYCQSY